ncbi:DinB family protein [Williamsia herbipolensis]|uniref:DinB family protein n=1 Tax=Williamsia herbipolensis TaxID=1603258 RepID=A0AAU4K0Q2_9NOCA|nr:DinB family protein [Williamsia herbipolensis]
MRERAAGAKLLSMMIASANIPGERETLIEIYGDQRTNLLIAIDGVSEADARRAAAVGELTLGGLVKHLTIMEQYWITTVTEADPDAEFDVDAAADAYRLTDDESFADWVDAYRKQAQLTDEFIATVADLDALIPIPTAPWAPVRQHHTVRRILLHLFRETAHHSGHADLIREAIDGQSTTATMARDAIRSFEHG